MHTQSSIACIHLAVHPPQKRSSPEPVSRSRQIHQLNARYIPRHIPHMRMSPKKRLHLPPRPNNRHQCTAIHQRPPFSPSLTYRIMMQHHNRRFASPGIQLRRQPFQLVLAQLPRVGIRFIQRIEQQPIRVLPLDDHRLPPQLSVRDSPLAGQHFPESFPLIVITHGHMQRYPRLHQRPNPPNIFPIIAYLPAQIRTIPRNQNPPRPLRQRQHLLHRYRQPLRHPARHPARHMYIRHQRKMITRRQHPRGKHPTRQHHRRPNRHRTLQKHATRNRLNRHQYNPPSQSS